MCFYIQHSFFDVRMATSAETLIDRLFIHWNGKPTADFDPKPAAHKFFTRKDRQMNLPTVSSCIERDFVSKFFAKKVKSL